MKKKDREYENYVFARQAAIKFNQSINQNVQDNINGWEKWEQNKWEYSNGVNGLVWFESLFSTPSILLRPINSSEIEFRDSVKSHSVPCALSLYHSFIFYLYVRCYSVGTKTIWLICWTIEWRIRTHSHRMWNCNVMWWLFTLAR